MAHTTTNDPFAAFGSDWTVIKPSAGRAPAEPARQPADPAPAASPSSDGAEAWPDDAAPATPGLNPLVAAAVPLLAAAPRIRHCVQHADPAGLRRTLAEGIHAFDTRIRAQGLPQEQVVAARYILCTLLDESAAATPWGGSGNWSSRSLLVQFHNEAWGGEKVFQLMSKLAANVPANRNLLELLYLALAFGFEGRYRVLSNCRAQLDDLRGRLGRLLREGCVVEPEVSPHWQTSLRGHKGLRGGAPLWVVAAATGALLLLVFLGFRVAVNQASDPVFTALRSLDVAAEPTPLPARLAPAAPRLRRLLQAEVDSGRLQVIDLLDRSIVVFKGDGLFEPGSAEISAPLRPVLERLADALRQTPGTVLVSGHTDNRSIRSLRFPSNWHLSQARAGAVRAALAERVDAARLRAEGRADAEPAADNATAEGRASNRRVEVTLFAQPSS